METKFKHSIKVPNQLRKAAKVVRKTFEEGASIKGLIFEEKHVRTQRLYALIVKISKHKNDLDHIIEKSNILIENPRLDKYMCMVLMTELLFGTGKLSGESKPVECVRNYKEKFDAILNEKTSNVSSADTTDNKSLKENAPNPRYVRVNTNLMSRSEAIEAFEKDGWIDIGSGIDNESSYDKFLELVANLGDMDYISDLHVQNLFVFPASSKKFWALNPLVKEAKIILQDKASCLPAMLLAPPKKSIVLDMCAAPGGKTTQLAAIMKNKGCIYAVEQNTGRFEILAKRKKLTNSSIVKLFNQDVLTITDEQIPNVQYIMIDPSCSGSGMIDQLLRFDENKKPDGLYNLAGLQIKILSYAMGTFKHAQKIVYSTCSIYPEENEEVVQRCLEMCPHWELIKPLEFAEKWKNFGSPKYKHIGKKCIYAKPEIDFTNGFFVAVFQRREDVEFDYDANRKKYWSRERAAEKYHAVDDDYEDDGGVTMENYNDMETIDNGKANDIIENESEIISKNGQSNEVDELTEKVKAKKKKKKKNKETALKVDPGDSITISTEVKETSNNSDDIEKIDLVECKVNKKKRIRNDSELLSKNESNEIDESIEKVKTKKKKKEKLIEEDIIDKEKEKTDQVEDLIVKKMKKKKKHSHDNE